MTFILKALTRSLTCCSVWREEGARPAVFGITHLQFASLESLTCSLRIVEADQVLRVLQVVPAKQTVRHHVQHRVQSVPTPGEELGRRYQQPAGEVPEPGLRVSATELPRVPPPIPRRDVPCPALLLGLPGPGSRVQQDPRCMLAETDGQ